LQVLTDGELKDTVLSNSGSRYWNKVKPGQSFQDCYKEETGKDGFYQTQKLNPKHPSPTLPADAATRSKILHWAEPRNFTYREWKRLGSFPDDYHAKTDKIGKYMIGMSVPPRMTEAVARAVIDQWLMPDA
jgi:site-specific DNA-cytosine methylase